jgi:ribosome-associated toxin RatA of RatAB toxin-antitoxin module
MPTIQCQAEVEARADELFALALDPRARKRWDPFTLEHGLLDGAEKAAVGVRSWIRARNGLRMETRYIALDAPERVAMTMTEGPHLFRTFSGTWSFKPADGERAVTRVVFRYHFTLRGGAPGRLFEPLVAWMLRREMSLRVLGLKRAAEQGVRAGFLFYG